jgi:leader peptidase (prepilin peptidase)/N-methyltransferase
LAIIYILYAIVGWLAGIGINHAADILPTRKTVFQRPTCPECGTPRSAAQWSALVSLANKRVCSRCGAARATFLRSIVVELIMPLMFIFLMWHFWPVPYLWLVSVYSVILVLVTVTDLEHRLIFNVVMLPAILLAIAAAFVVPSLYWRAALAGGVGAFVVVYVAALIARGGLGEGDVTLSAFLGFAMGFPLIVLAIMFGVFLGGFTALLLLLTGKVGMKSFIPYGPFLTITGWIMLVWGNEIWQYYFY